ncbi:hypothetical protein EZV62_002462 [Acer yangbiense]|uniref:Uncharacterized protein n=1 Tax=Acer yangbiense TaxID=1000413 RepID=A0A5C7IXI1_9ROSI|nr:hypothetical protein EZV62_002462 [Acer yangbiense]
MIERRAKAEAEEIAKKQIRVDLEGWRLLAVRAAERSGFWYTVNLLGFSGGAAGDDPTLLSLAAPPPVVSIVNGERFSGHKVEAMAEKELQLCSVCVSRLFEARDSNFSLGKCLCLFQKSPSFVLYL